MILSDFNVFIQRAMVSSRKLQKTDLVAQFTWAIAGWEHHENVLLGTNAWTKINGLWDIGDRPLRYLLDLQPQHNAHNDFNGNVEQRDRTHRGVNLFTHQRCDKQDKVPQPVEDDQRHDVVEFKHQRRKEKTP